MDELFANCETILDSVYMSILLDPSLFVFQNFNFIILFFLILCDKFSFINMTDRLRHQWEKKRLTRLLVPNSFSVLFTLNCRKEWKFCIQVHISIPEDMQRFEFHVHILFVINQNFCEPAPTESTSTPWVFNKAIFCLYMWERSSPWYGCLKTLC